MRVLGVDPGLTRCGVAIVDASGAQPQLDHVDAVRTDRDAPLAMRLHELHQAITNLIARFDVDEVAVERVLFSVNVQSAMATGQALGVALVAAAAAGCAVVEYSPNEIKQAVAGHGGADKDDVARMVKIQLHLEAAPEPADAADAAAVALTHLARRRTTLLGVPAVDSITDKIAAGKLRVVGGA